MRKARHHVGLAVAAGIEVRQDLRRHIVEGHLGEVLGSSMLRGDDDRRRVGDVEGAFLAGEPDELMGPRPVRNCCPRNVRADSDAFVCHGLVACSSSNNRERERCGFLDLVSELCADMKLVHLNQHSVHQGRPMTAMNPPPRRWGDGFAMAPRPRGVAGAAVRGCASSIVPRPSPVETERCSIHNLERFVSASSGLDTKAGRVGLR